MSDDVERQKAKLEKMGRLIERYAQSRSLGLLLFVVLIALGTVLSVLLMELLLRKPTWWLAAIVILSLTGTSVLGLWLMFKVFPRYERRLYSKEGQIELEQKKVPIWACIVYVVAFLVPVVLNTGGIMPTRWALTVPLVSLGIFVFYAGAKEEQKPLATLFCVVLLLEAAVTAVGVPTPFYSKGWLYSCFAALMIYIAGASLITAVVVHIYNRAILRKIKQTRPFGE